MANPDDPHTYGLNLATAMTISALCAIAWVNTIELQFRIWLGFKRYAGLYFWSLVLSSWGCAIHPLAFLFLDSRIINQANALGVIIGVSWWCMVTGQALVLYSRLHLVVRDTRRLRWILIMIITNFCILHLPIMVLSQVAYSPVPNASKWLSVYNIYEKIQMTGFTIQESIISGLYLYEAHRILKPGRTFRKEKTNEVLRHLIWVNVFVIGLDAALLATEYAGLFNIQTVFKAAVYSVKLRFELVVLNQLMEIVGGSSRVGSSNSPAYASGPNGTGRSGRNIQLGTLEGRPHQGRADPYSAFASSDTKEPTVEARADGMLKTTEIRVIDGVEKMTDEHDQSKRHRQSFIGGPLTTRSRGRSHSPASSEIQFAAEGGLPGVAR